MRQSLIELTQLEQELERRATDERLNYYQKPLEHKIQVEFHQSLKRNRWLFGGNRTGKTVGGAVEAVWMARGNHPFKDVHMPTRGWIVSLTNEVQRDVAQKEILRWLNPRWIKDIHVRSGKKDDPQNAIIDFIVVESQHGGDSIIGFKSCDQGRAKFQGTSQHWIWFDEEPPKDIYDECKMRIIDTRGDIWGTMTPLLGLTWVYDDIYINEKSDPNVKYWMMEWADNPYLSTDEIAELESTMSEDEREARQYGKFVAMSGLVYKEFREDIHVIDPFEIPKHWYADIAIDPGFTNPLSSHFYAVDGDGTIYVIEEHYKAETTVEEHSGSIWAIAKRLKWKKSANDGLNALIDPAANQKTLAAEKSVKQLFSDYKIYCRDANNDVWSGIQRVKEYLKLRPNEQIDIWPKGKPKLFIFRTCPNMIAEFKSYRWSEPTDKKNTDEKPIKKRDHAMDELRYFIMTRPQPSKMPKNQPGDGYYSEAELKDYGFKEQGIVKPAKGKAKVLR